MNFIQDCTKLFINSIMPFKCPVCGTEGISHGLCSNCWNSIKIINTPMCKICGIPFQTNIDMLCIKCSVSLPAYDYSRSFAIYSEPIKSIITKLKQYPCSARSEILARWIYSTLKNWQEIDYIVYIPSSKLRLLYRGHNPVANICYSLKYLVGKPILPLLGAYHTDLQQGKNSKERIYNVKNKFYIREYNIKENSTICLIDDVTTTGATLNEAAKIIKKKYKINIICITAAKTCSYIY